MANRRSRKNPAARLGIESVRITRFLGEGEAVQPVEQIAARCGEHPVLREMNMGIDEARHDQAIAIIIDRDAGDRSRGRRLQAPAHRMRPSRPMATAPCISWLILRPPMERTESGRAPRVWRSWRDAVLDAEAEDAADLAPAQSRTPSSAELFDALGKGRENLLLGGAPHREDEGKAELRLVATIEVGRSGTNSSRR